MYPRGVCLFSTYETAYPTPYFLWIPKAPFFPRGSGVYLRKGKNVTMGHLVRSGGIGLTPRPAGMLLGGMFIASYKYTSPRTNMVRAFSPPWSM